MLSWDDVLGVELIDTNAETDIVIADDLVSRGLAQYKTDKSKKDRGIVIIDTHTHTHAHYTNTHTRSMLILYFILLRKEFYILRLLAEP